MAVATEDMFTSAEASVTVTFENTTGAISTVNWIVTSGSLVVTVYKSGQANIKTAVLTTSGSRNIPAGYNLTQGPKGDWKWLGDPAFETTWTA